jgi:hypothetical protein
MQLFTKSEYKARYDDEEIDTTTIEEASDMIFAQCSPMYRRKWTSIDVPEEIKRACLVQAKFLKDYEIPDIDYKSKVKAGEMETELSSHYSTYALTILANAGYMYRGSLPNFFIDINLGD